jgi:protoheme IX farnesyltransferase
VKQAPAQVAPARISLSRRSVQPLVDYVALTKPRLNFLVVVTSAAGYYLGAPPSAPLGEMAAAVAGTTLLAGGAASLNQVYERDTDGLMRRTRTRPLPDGRISSVDATIFGTILSAAGLAVLAAKTNLLAALLALATILIYLTIYTPLKRRSPAATLIGAIPGALPPLIGWAAAHGSVALGGAGLFAIVFLWQVPHFMAIAWLYRDDYGTAGFPLLPVIDPGGRRAGRQALIYAAALVPASAIPALAGVTGTVSLVATLVLGIVLLVLAGQFASERSDRTARRLFYASITYLPLVWIAMVADKR